MIRHFIAASGAAALIIGAAALFLVATPIRVQAAECAGQAGVASWYGIAHQGKPMANKRPFDRHAMTAASWNYPLGTVVKVRSQRSGKEIRVTITDRGPARRLHRILDLSEAAFAKLAPTGQGLTKVCVTRVR